MKKISKILIGITLLFFIIYFILGLIFDSFLSEKIELAILEKIEKSLNAEISPETKLDFSFWGSFPYAAVNISNASIIKNDDEIFNANSVVVKISMLNLLMQDYNIKDVAINDGGIKIIQYDLDSSNIYIENAQINKTEFLIKKIYADNFQIQYENIKEGHNYDLYFEKSKLSINSHRDTVEIFFDGTINANIIESQNTKFLSEEKIYGEIELKKYGDNITLKANQLTNGSLTLDNLNLLYRRNEFNLDIRLTNQKISEVIKLVPKNYTHLINEIKIGGGIDINCSVKFDTLINVPRIKADFKIHKGHLNIQDFTLEEVSMNGSVENGDKRCLASSIIKIEEFNSKKSTGHINGSAIIENLLFPRIEAKIDSKWELQEINEFINESPFKNVSGEIFGNTHYKGRLSFDSTMFSHIKKSENICNWEFRNAEFNYKNSPLNFKFKQAAWKIVNNIINISPNSFIVSKSNLNFDGNVENLLLYIFGVSKKIYINGYLFSSNTDFKELMKILDTGGEEKNDEYVFPDWLDVNLKIKANNFKYGKFESNNLESEIKYDSKKHHLSARKTKMNSLNGNIDGEINYYENKIHDLILKANLNLTKIDISKAFENFENFNQDFIESNNIKGNANMNLYIQSIWDREYNLYEESLNINADVKINNGQLIKFSPMYSLSNYVSLEELKNIKFATLENKIRLEGSKIIIPKMEIKSNAMDMQISGIHDLKNNMDYKIRLLISDLLAKKVKEKTEKKDLKSINPQSESGKTSIQFKMTGNVKDPKISLDKIQLKKDVVEGIIKETKNIKKIIKDDILDNTNKIKKDSLKESGIIIEWDDD